MSASIETAVEFETMRAQLLIFAKEIAEVYRSERKQSKRLADLMDELRAGYLNVIKTLALIVEQKDPYTSHHLERCREYGRQLAHELDPSIVTLELEYGFLLHDIGKIGVPEAVLRKPGPLNDQESQIMRKHPILGMEIVEPLRRILDASTFNVIKHHHERFDGTGYPDGLSGGDIPLEARIFAVVDAFDAMTTDRPYRAALSYDQAVEQLRDGAGNQFDPLIVEAFERISDGLLLTA